MFYLPEVSLFMSGSVRSLCIHNILRKASKKFLLLMIGQKILFGGWGEVGRVRMWNLKCAKSEVLWLIVAVTIRSLETGKIL